MKSAIISSISGVNAIVRKPSNWLAVNRGESSTEFKAISAKKPIKTASYEYQVFFFDHSLGIRVKSNERSEA